MQARTKVYLVAGVPASGKSWACNQVKDRYDYVEHDSFIYDANPRKAYVEEISDRARNGAQKPVLCETPFSVSQIKEPLETLGFTVECLYLIEDRHTLQSRYYEREGKDIPKGHLTRNATFRDRAEQQGAFQGTSEEVLRRLQDLISVKN